jgi:Fe(3+) dicitrate transport protein
MKWWSVGIVMGLAVQTWNLNARATNEVVRLPAVIISEPSSPVTDQALPVVTGGRIFDGKKTTQAVLRDAPVVIADNHRQAFGRLPGLLIAEAAVPTHLNQNYRGVGDPHESEFVLTLKDGRPIVSDWLGYSTVYYTPPFETVERLEFVRGGASLLYGPQPGPVINYVTAVPPAVPWRFTTQHLGGSDDLYSTYTSLGGTHGALGYLGWFHHVQAAGARRNADYEINSGAGTVQWHSDAGTFTLRCDGFAKEVGEAGRLSRAQYKADRDFTRTPHDRVWVDRYVPALDYDRELSADTHLSIKTWGGYLDRFSRRQANALTNNLDRHEFYFAGLDARLRHDWLTGDETHTWTVGAVGYGADSPRSRERGTPLTANSGTPAFDLERTTAYGAVFSENIFRIGRLSLVPGVRVDFNSIAVRERFNTTVTRALIDGDEFHIMPLGGLGLTYRVADTHEVYANVSTGYRPIKYDDVANPTSNSQLPPSDLEPSLTWTYEIGARGAVGRSFQYDTSVFFIDYRDYIENRDLGGGNSERSNSGRAQYLGWEVAGDLDLLQLCRLDRYGQLSLYGSLSLLRAEFVEGLNDGNRPAYAPDYVVKTGLVYRRGAGKLAWTGNVVGDAFWQDNNTAGSVGQNEIPAYDVWDLTGEVAVWRDTVTIVAGINNVFDQDYYSRIRSDGIEPTARRNYYLGVKLLLP